MSTDFLQFAKMFINYGCRSSYSGSSNYGCSSSNWGLFNNIWDTCSDCSDWSTGEVLGALSIFAVGTIGTKIYEGGQTRKAEKNAQEAKDQAQITKDLSTLGITGSIDKLTVNDIDNAIATKKSAKETELKKPVDDANTKVSNANTKEADLNSIKTQVSALTYPEGFTPSATAAETYDSLNTHLISLTKELESVSTQLGSDSTNETLKTRQKDLEAKIKIANAAKRELAKLKEEEAKWDEPNGEKYKALKTAEENLEKANSTYTSEVEKAEEEINAAADRIKAIINKRDAQQMNKDIDDADGNIFNSSRKKPLDKIIGENNNNNVNTLSVSDWRGLIWKYTNKNANADEKSKIKSYIQAKWDAIKELNLPNNIKNMLEQIKDDDNKVRVSAL